MRKISELEGVCQSFPMACFKVHRHVKGDLYYHGGNDVAITKVYQRCYQMNNLNKYGFRMKYFFKPKDSTDFTAVLKYYTRVS